MSVWIVSEQDAGWQRDRNLYAFTSLDAAINHLRKASLLALEAAYADDENPEQAVADELAAATSSATSASGMGTSTATYPAYEISIMTIPEKMAAGQKWVHEAGEYIYAIDCVPLQER